MIKHDDDSILMIEPSAAIAPTPIIDGLTRRMAAALNAAARQNPSRGWHVALSGAESDNAEHVVACADGARRTTNSLAVHYLAYSRHEIPADMLEFLGRVLPAVEAEPTPAQLYPGQERAARNRQIYHGAA